MITEATAPLPRSSWASTTTPDASLVGFAWYSSSWAIRSTTSSNFADTVHPETRNLEAGGHHRRELLGEDVVLGQLGPTRSGSAPGDRPC